MKFLSNLLASTGKLGDGEGDVPFRDKIASFFKDLRDFTVEKT